ncbi:peptidoglycan-binding protein [Streptomyces sp. NEAU-W12]|uniref:peptidoglycan-binding protein n=1 Tax=Streptomyces sp. NEAU-W12 TaxID=2994668 RepID=UPI00224AD706|nr:peptidoglycan-binding protein [Streptomyces sp. NEAU-W12]MCX2924428.1 peptidoglycan-binding protein [Streptomyces sp. NEAU-W12]
MNMRRAAASLATLGLLATGAVVGTAGTAQAATHCQGYSTYTTQYGDYQKPTTTTGSRNVTCVLSSGDGYNGGAQNTAVRLLQRSLNRCFPGADLAVDGMYGPATANKVKEVQRSKGLAVDGVLGPQTSRYMNWAMTGATGCTYGGSA